MMNNLSTYFSGIAAKRLSQVEINSKISNQHEFQGIHRFKKIMGTERKEYDATFIYLDDNEESLLREEGCLTWYDARIKNPNRSAEFRFYYTTNSVTTSANAGDLLIFAKTNNDEVFVIISAEKSTSEQQMKWLFGLDSVETRATIKPIKENNLTLNFAGRYVLESIGIEIPEDEDDWLEIILNKFGSKFPKTYEFSAFARSTLKDISPLDEPDTAIIAYLEREELLFKTLEKHIVSQKLKEGFGTEENNVDEFIRYSLSVQNRRKSRAGHSFENHLDYIFSEHNLQFSRGKKTERNNKPDFLFPGAKLYHTEDFNVDLLTMLGVKTTAKDRWRQVLSEAEKIKNKHLITLEPAISENQIREMNEQHLQLVIPEELSSTYTKEQNEKIIYLDNFISLVKDKQKRIS